MPRTRKDVDRLLAYVGLVLVAYELIRGMIVGPIKAFYQDTTFGEGLPFKSYEDDVLSRHKNEFEACLLYLKDFMQAIDAHDFASIQSLRKHRNDLAHNIVARLDDLTIEDHLTLLEEVRQTLDKLSNYRAYMEVGADPEFMGINWETAKGGEYILFEEVLSEIKILETQRA
jgi:hypothetical protein